MAHIHGESVRNPNYAGKQAEVWHGRGAAWVSGLRTRAFAASQGLHQIIHPELLLMV